MLSVQKFPLCQFCLLSIFLLLHGLCPKVTVVLGFQLLWYELSTDVPALPWRPLPLSSDLGVPSPFLILLCVPSSSYYLLAFPFVRHVFSESPSPWLQGSVMPQGWSIGLAGMDCFQHWATSGLSPWRLPLQLSPANTMVPQAHSDLYYLDHFHFLLLFCFQSSSKGSSSRIVIKKLYFYDNDLFSGIYVLLQCFKIPASVIWTFACYAAAETQISLNPWRIHCYLNHSGFANPPAIFHFGICLSLNACHIYI